MHQNQQFDFYVGGGLDVAVLGMAEADAAGNGPDFSNAQPMDARIFWPEPMDLKSSMLNLDLTDRLAYDADRNTLFLNFEGVQVRRVAVVVNYNAFRLDPEVADAYADMVRGLDDAYYGQVSRYTTSAFMRVKLAQTLARTVRPHLFETRDEAHAFHDAMDQ